MEDHRTHLLPWAVSYVESLSPVCAPAFPYVFLREKVETYLRRCEVWDDNRLTSLQLDGTLETTQPKLPNKIWIAIKCKNECQGIDARSFEKWDWLDLEEAEKGRIWTGLWTTGQIWWSRANEGNKTGKLGGRNVVRPPSWREEAGPAWLLNISVPIQRWDFTQSLYSQGLVVEII